MILYIIGGLLVIGIIALVISYAIVFYYVSIPLIISISLFLKYRQRIDSRIKNRISPEQNHLIEFFRIEFFRALNKDHFLKKYNATLVSKSKRGNTLYSVSGIIPRKKIKILRYLDPSTQEEYMCFVPEKIKSADKAMAWKFYLTEEEYGDIITEA